MKNFLLVLFLICSLSFSIDAQSVTISEDATISRMVGRSVQINRSKGRISGWRIQLIATTNRSKVENEKRKFIRNYPFVHVDWTHSKPYYKLRAGAFQSKLDAARLLYRIRKDYPSAYPAKDNIAPRELVGI